MDSTGFDHYFGLLGGNHHYFKHMDRIGVPDLWSGNTAVTSDDYTTDLLARDAIGFIRRHRDGPFFLYLSHAAPHFPWLGPGDRDNLLFPISKEVGGTNVSISFPIHRAAGSRS